MQLGKKITIRDVTQKISQYFFTVFGVIRVASTHVSLRCPDNTNILPFHSMFVTSTMKDFTGCTSDSTVCLH